MGRREKRLGNTAEMCSTISIIRQQVVFVTNVLIKQHFFMFYYFVPDEGSLLPKYINWTTPYVFT